MLVRNSGTGNSLNVFAYLSTTGSVLGSTTGNQLSILGHKLFIETHVLLLGENGIVVLETVLLKESGIT